MQEVQQQVDGEEFLRILHDHLLQHEKELKKILLPLNPSCIQFLNAKFRDIDAGSRQSQHLRFLSKRKPLTRSEILDLQFFLETLEKLRLESTQQDVLEENTEVTLTDVFRNLKELHIDRCRPKIVVDLEELSHYIERLTIVRAVSHLSEVLVPGDTDEDGMLEGPLTPDAASAKRWTKLKELRMPHNYIVNLDESLMLLTAVTVIDLSDNMIERIENLQFCYSLVTLDLSYNRIRSVHSSVHSLGNLRYLALRGNGLSSTLGLEKLLGLERLDLRDNNISSLEDVARLARLPFLEYLFLTGNPITQKKNYRREVYLHLHKESLILDGQNASRSEKEAARSSSFQPLDVDGAVSTHGVFTPPYPQAMALFGPPPASKSIYTSSSSNGSMRYISGGTSSSARSPSHLSSLYEPSTSYPGDGGMSAMVSAAAMSKRRAKAATARKRLAQIDSTATPENGEDDGATGSSPNDEGSSPDRGSSSGVAVARSPGGTLSPLKETIDKLHEGHGASWLLVYNEFKKSKAPPTASNNASTAAPASSSSSAKKKRDNRASLIMPQNPPASDPASQAPNAQQATAPVAPVAKRPAKPRPTGPFVLSMPIVTADDSGGSTDGPLHQQPQQLPDSSDSSPRAGSTSSVQSAQQPSGSPIQSSSSSPQSSLPGSPANHEPIVPNPISQPQTEAPLVPVNETPDASTTSQPSPQETEVQSKAPEPTETGQSKPPAVETIDEPSPQAEPAPAAPIVEKPINIAKVSSNAGPEDPKEQFEKTEEFYAEVQNDKGDWEPRILILTPKFIEEGDTTTGSSVVRHDLKHIVDARNLTDEVPGMSESEWLIRLDFRTSGTSSSHHTVCFYKLESATDAKRLTSSLRATIDKSTRKIKCITCNSEFKLQEIDACPRCKSAMLIFFDGAVAPSAVASSPPKAPAGDLALSSSPKDVSMTAPKVTAITPVWDESEPTLDGNKQLYLRLTFFKKDDNSETLASYFTCSYIPFGAGLSREATGSIMLSNLNIYILQPKSRRRTMILSAFMMGAQGYDDEDELVAAIPFGDVKRIVVGPFYQWFRIEVSPQQVFVFITRAHERTHKFLSTLKQTMRDKIGYVELSNRNQEILQNIALDCCPAGSPAPQLELFFWLFQRVKPGAGRSIPSISRSEVSVVSRTLIVTSEELLLVDEDTRLPFPNFAGAVKPKVPQFVVVHRRKISELSSIEVDPLQPNFVKLCFDEDSVSSSSKVNDGGHWGLFCQKSVESKKMTQVLAREWRALFHVPLTVIEMDGIAALSS